MKKYGLITIGLVILIIAVCVAGCSSLSAGDKQFIDALSDGMDQIEPIIENIGDHSRSEDLDALIVDGQALQKEASSQYTKISGITPTSSNLIMAKEYYLKALAAYQDVGKYNKQGAEAALRGAGGEANLAFTAAINRINDASDYLEKATDALKQ